MKRSLRTATVAGSALAMALVLPLVGCGGGSKPVDSASQKAAVAKKGPTGSEALAAGQKNLKDLKSVSVTGSLNDDNTKMKVAGKGSVEQGGDFELSSEGIDDGKHQALHLRSVDGTMYLQASDDFFKLNLGDSSGRMASAIGDKFLEVPSSRASTMPEMSLAELMDSTFSSDALTADDLADPSAKGKLVNFEGVQAYEYTVKDDDGEWTVYLSADGSEQFAGMRSAKEGTVLLTDHDKKFTIQAPDKDEIITVEELPEAAIGG